MRAKILKVAKEEGLEAIIEIENIAIEAMDCIGYSRHVSPGDELEVDLTIGLANDNESWDEIFSGNSCCLKKLERLENWSYLAFGEIISIDPMIVDCGIAKFDGVIDTHDPGCIGEFVAFTIDRLDVLTAE